MNKHTGQGVVMLVHNTENHDTMRLAMANCRLILRNMPGVSITVLTDKYSMSRTSAADINNIVDNVVIIDDTGEVTPVNIANAYKHTPYHETLLIDPGYLILDNSLDVLWNGYFDLVLSNTSQAIGESDATIQYANYNKDIEHIRSSVMYFKQSAIATHFFGCYEFINSQPHYCCRSFNLSSNVTQLEQALSIAHHIAAVNAKWEVSVDLIYSPYAVFDLPPSYNNTVVGLHDEQVIVKLQTNKGVIPLLVDYNFQLSNVQPVHMIELEKILGEVCV